MHNSHANAARLGQALMALAPAADHQAVEDSCLIICHLWGHMIRLAVLADDNARAENLLDQ
ncbi:MAG: hypothetical protein AAFX04_08730 [Pseudomonadota bacterium]